MTKLVVFDVDGTFLDSLGFMERVINEYSRLQGLPIPDIEAIKIGYANPLEHDFGWGVTPGEQVKHMSGVYALMDRHSMSGDPTHAIELFAGVEESLMHLKDLGHTLALITSKPEAPLLHSLEYHDIGKLFSARRAHDDVNRRGEKEKPAPDMLHSVMRELKFVPDETVMIGDTIMDIRMGRAAQTNTVGVTWGAHLKHRLVEAGAHHIVETHFNDIPPAIKKLFG